MVRPINAPANPRRTARALCRVAVRLVVHLSKAFAAACLAPRFWPNDAHAPSFEAHQMAFQVALGMRYRFLPFLYSLAHVAYRTGRPISHPASFSFPVRQCTVLGPGGVTLSNTSPLLPSGSAARGSNPSDTSCCRRHLTGAPLSAPWTKQGDCVVSKSAQCQAAEATYMVGGVLIPSDLSLAHTNERPPPLENMSVAVLPGAETSWYRWNTTTARNGGQTVKETLALAEMAIFVKAGAILPLNANTSVQRSAEIGGLLELQVYAGQDGSFELIEDDGISYDYQTAAIASTRTTTWSWTDATKTLSWSVRGGYSAGPNLYTSVLPVLFAVGATQPQQAGVQALGKAGKVVFH